MCPQCPPPEIHYTINENFCVNPIVDKDVLDKKLNEWSKEPEDSKEESSQKFEKYKVRKHINIDTSITFQHPKIQKQIDKKIKYLSIDYETFKVKVEKILSQFSELHFEKFAFEISPFNSILFKLLFKNGLRLNVSKSFSNLESEGVSDDDLLVTIFHNKELIEPSVIISPKELVKLVNQTI